MVEELTDQQEMLNLVNEVHGIHITSTEFQSRLHPRGQAHAPLLLGIRQAGKLVACNGFIHHEMQYEGISVPVYQSCFSSTHPDDQGQGHFTELIESAKEALIRSDRARFLIGFPNSNSFKTFTTKLNFRFFPLHKIYVPAMKPFSVRRVKSPVRGEEHLLKSSHDDLLKWHHQHALVTEYRLPGGRIWGKIITRRRAGIPVKLFVAGDLAIRDRESWLRLSKVVFRNTQAQFIVLHLAATDPFMSKLQIYRRSRGIPFIVYGKDPIEIEALRLRLGPGLSDSF